MKSIICATDFSENAYVALKYAANLAKDLNAELVIYHAYHTYGPLVSGNEYVINLPITVDKGKENKKKIAQLAKEIKEINPDLTISEVSEDVELTYGLQQYINSHSTLLVVMGNRGMNQPNEILYGNSVMDAIQTLSCPVLSVPKNTYYKMPKKFIYAHELEDEDIKVTKRLIELADMFRAHVYLAHFFEEANLQLQQDADEFNRTLKEEVNYSKFKANSQTYGDLEDYINEEIHKREADVLAMRERKHGLIYDIFHKDRVKEMLKHTELPLLVYNSECLK